MIASFIELFAIVGFASLSDRVGRRPVYLFGAHIAADAGANAQMPASLARG